MLLSCGDALIDFLPTSSQDGRDALVPVVGGSCLNIAIGMARLGAPAAFLGGVSSDLFGCQIAEHAQASGVDLRYVTRSPHQSTLAFVRKITGEPQYAFYDEATAARNWTYGAGSLPFQEIDAIHVGSTTLVDGRLATQTLQMIEEARDSVTISFDPNCRPALVADKVRYVDRMNAFAAHADIIRMSDADFDFLYGSRDAAWHAEALLDGGAGLVMITKGERGVQAWHRAAGTLEVGVPLIAVADTIGAGDSFQAALLVGLRLIGRIDRTSLARISRDELGRVLAFAAACAAVTCTRPGADPPWRAELDGDLFKSLGESERG